MKQNLIDWVKNAWSKTTAFFKGLPKKYFVIGAIVLVIVVLIAVAGGSKFDESEQYTVVRDTVVQSVALAGTVESLNNSNLGFADGGRVARVYVEEGNTVSRGQVLAQLDIADLNARLKDAQAQVVIAQNSATTKTTNVPRINAEQNAIVESARLVAYGNLAAVPSDVFIEQTAPIISGTYTGTVDGSYVIEVYASNSSTGASFRYSGLETGVQDVTLNTDVPLGTRGLFIRFQDSAGYANTKWTVAVPNKRWSGYARAYSDYQAALSARDRAIADAQDEVSNTEGQSILQARLAQAQAGVDEINASIARRTIRAPFAGVVGTIDVSEGESVAPNTGVIKLIGKDVMQVVLSVPELDIHAFSENQKVTVTFDAFDGEYEGIVSRIDPGETVKDGVPVYLVAVDLTNPDAKIRSGMTARVSLETRVSENVIAVPTYLVEIGKGSAKVRVLKDKEAVDAPVTIGLQGTNGLTEITSGVSEGDILVPLVVAAY